MKRGRVVAVERDGVKKEKGALSGRKGKAGARATRRETREENEFRRVPKRTTSRLPVRNEHHDSRRADDETRARAVALADAPWCDPTGGSARYRTARPAASGRWA